MSTEIEGGGAPAAGRSPERDVPDAGASLYNRHRPRTFADMVGQDHVARALANALASGSPPRAYLFSGPRGTGKTTTARILARCLNCLSSPAPTSEPCGTCESCLRTGHEDWLDVLEVDAASSARRIDEMRDWLESVKYPPVACRYRITIMDEAHQIQDQAASALLKTLEEPPPYLVVILCTTHPWDILPTIRSRLQHYVLRRPGVPDLVKVLERVARTEGFETSEQALDIVARAADGSYRDALGLLEQVATYAGGRVEVGDALELIGAVSREAIFQLIDLVVGGHGGEAIEMLESTMDAGTDPEQLMRGLVAHLRYLFLLQQGARPREEWGLAQEELTRLEAQSHVVSASAVVRALDLLADAQLRIRNGADARLQLELVAAKMGRPALDPTLEGLATRIANLERGLPAGGPPAAAPGATPSPAPAPAPPAPPPVPDAGPSPAPVPAPDPVAEPAPAPVAPEPPPVAEAPAAVAPAPSSPPVPVAAPVVPVDQEHLERIWPQVMTAIEESSPPTWGFLEGARILSVGADGVRIGVPSAMRVSMLGSPDHRQRVAQALGAALGGSVGVSFEQVAPAEPVRRAPEGEVSREEHDRMLRERMRELFDAVEESDEYDS